MGDKTSEERIKELENSLSIALEISDKYQGELKELKEDNKKLAKEVGDKADLVKRLRNRGGLI
jgi:FtsZ-binding cell division protein ZapB